MLSILYIDEFSFNVHWYSVLLFSESYTQAVHNPVTPSLRALKRQSPPASPSIKKRHGIRASFGKGLKKLRGHKSSSEPNIGKYCNLQFLWSLY